MFVINEKEIRNVSGYQNNFAVKEHYFSKTNEKGTNNLNFKTNIHNSVLITHNVSSNDLKKFREHILIP